MDTRQKIEQCLLDCGKIIKGDCQSYCTAVEQGCNHITLLIAHMTTVKNIKTSEIQDTETFEMYPTIQSMLEFAIKKEICAEKIALAKILDDLEKIQSNIIKQCDKVFNMYRSGVQCNLSLDDITENNEISFSIAEKIEALDKFKRRIINFHLGKMYSIEYCNSDGDLNKLCNLWKVSDLLSAEQDLACIIFD